MMDTEKIHTKAVYVLQDVSDKSYQRKTQQKAAVQ